MDNIIEENELLLFYLNTSVVLDSGEVVFKRKRVDTIEHYNVEVRISEHAPPHFHVISDKLNASFNLMDCSLLKGNASKNDIAKIQAWYKQKRNFIINQWNETRPSNCPVGAYAK